MGAPAHVNTYMHTQKPALIAACRHAYIRIYKCLYTHENIPTCMHACMCVPIDNVSSSANECGCICTPDYACMDKAALALIWYRNI